MPKKHSYDYVKAFIESRNIVLLSTEYIDSKTKMHMQCLTCFYKWYTIFNTIQQGHGCPSCAGCTKYTLEEVRKIMYGCDGLLLSEYYSNNKQKLHIKCNKDSHEWNPTLHNILHNNQWCPKCAGRPDYTIDIVKSIIESKNGTLLSEEYINSITPLHIICNKCSYDWWPRFAYIQQGNWCPNCAGRPKRTHSDVKKYIDILGYTLLTNHYINNKQPLDILCRNCSNTWTTIFNSIVSGKSCPTCSVGKSQRNLLRIIKAVYPNQPIYNNYRQFNWLVSDKNTKQEVDIWLPNLKIAIEYDGEQHFKPVNFGGISDKEANSKLKRTKQLDQNKNQLIAQHPQDIHTFIRFNYKENITEEYVSHKIQQELNNNRRNI